MAHAARIGIAMALTAACLAEIGCGALGQNVTASTPRPHSAALPVACALAGGLLAGSVWTATYQGSEADDVVIVPVMKLFLVAAGGAIVAGVACGVADNPGLADAGEPPPIRYLASLPRQPGPALIADPFLLR